MFLCRKSVLGLFLVSGLILLSGACRSASGGESGKEEKKEVKKSRSTWSQIQQQLDDDRRKKRLSSDMYHLRNDKFEVFPGRHSSRSARIAEEGLTPIPTLW